MTQNNIIDGTIGIIGYTGFVGKNIIKNIKFDFLYNSKNIEEIQCKEFDTLFFCGLPAKKWYANLHPDEDYNNMKSIMDNLKNVKAKKFILISTIDVYDVIDGGYDETYLPNFEKNHTYGKNRYLFELFVKNKFDDHLIIRLPALFGKGLKKNIIYDLMNNNQVEKIPINSSFQWYSLDWLIDDIKTCILYDVKTCNLFTEPLETMKIIDLFDYSNDIFTNNKKICYDIKTNKSQIFNFVNGKYIRGSEDVYNAIKKFVIETKQLAPSSNYKLCISNICNKISDKQFYSLLDLYQINHLEIAPTVFFSWKEINTEKMLDVKKTINDHKLQLYSFQSITYTLNELNLFDKNKTIELLNHLKNVIKLAGELGIKILVFGCPKNRKMLDDSNELIAIEFFRSLNDVAKKHNVTICIENNSKQYNCNFLNTVIEAGNFVKKLGCSNIKLMADLGNMIMEQEPLDNLLIHKDIIKHIHISQPHMIMFDDPHPQNLQFKKILKMINYDGVITLEMINRDSNFEKFIESLEKYTKYYIN
jgi:sugar phosphate isomerase/epimerase